MNIRKFFNIFSVFQKKQIKTQVKEIKNIIANLENIGVNKRYIGSISFMHKYKWFSSNNFQHEIEIEIYNLKLANELRQKYKHPYGKVNIIYRGDIPEKNIKVPGASTWCKMDKQEKQDYTEWMNAVNSININF